MSTVDNQIVAEMRRLEQQVLKQEAYLKAKEQVLKEMESRINQGLSKNNSAQNLQSNVARNMGNFLVPGNVGDINKVVWPFWFTTPAVTVGPGQNVTTQFSVTQEAGFSWMSYVKCVYDLDTLTNDITYIDPAEPAIGEASMLYYSIRDAQSSREFFNKPQALDAVGAPQFPSTLPTPLFFLPNSTIEVSFYNSHPTNNYIPFLVMFGYRIRVEGAKTMLGTVYG